MEEVGIQHFPVDLRDNADTLMAQLQRQLTKIPSGKVEKIEPFGFAFHREPDLLSIIAAGPMLGMALRMAEYSRVSAFSSRVGIAFTVSFAIVGLWLLWRFTSNAVTRFEVLAEGQSVVLRRSFGRFFSKEIRYDSEKITTVDIVRTDGDTPRVLLGGPRHTTVGEVFCGRYLDPDTLTLWMAESTAIIARRASILQEKRYF